MTAPVDDALIVATRPNVDPLAPWGPQTQLGRTEHRCLRCGKDWGEPPEVPLNGGSRTCPYCGHNVCEVIVHKAVAVELRGGQMVAVAEPPKINVLAASSDLDALRDLRTALGETDARLGSATEAAKRLTQVNATNRELFGRFAEVLNLMTTEGGFEIRVSYPLRAVGLRMVVRALIGEIDTVLATYEEESKK